MRPDVFFGLFLASLLALVFLLFSDLREAILKKERREIAFSLVALVSFLLLAAAVFARLVGELLKLS